MRVSAKYETIYTLTAINETYVNEMSVNKTAVSVVAEEKAKE